MLQLLLRDIDFVICPPRPDTHRSSTSEEPSKWDCPSKTVVESAPGISKDVASPSASSLFFPKRDFPQVRPLADRTQDILCPREGSVLGKPYEDLLYTAVHQGYLPMVKCLLERKADLNLEYKTEGISVLQLAVAMGHFAIADTLLVHGADSRLLKEDPTCFGSWFYEVNSTQKLKDVIDGQQYAIAEVMVEHMLKHGAHNRLLGFAIEEDNLGMVKALLEEGSDCLNPPLPIENIVKLSKAMLGKQDGIIRAVVERLLLNNYEYKDLFKAAITADNNVMVKILLEKNKTCFDSWVHGANIVLLSKAMLGKQDGIISAVVECLLLNNYEYKDLFKAAIAANNDVMVKILLEKDKTCFDSWIHGTGMVLLSKAIKEMQQKIVDIMLSAAVSSRFPLLAWFQKCVVWLIARFFILLE